MQRSNSHSKGGIIIFLAVMLLVLIALCALVVDGFRIRRALRSLQRTADAAALAGTLQLQAQQIDGWKNAKRAALAAIKQNPIFGVKSTSAIPDTLPDSQTLTLPGGHSWSNCPESGPEKAAGCEPTSSCVTFLRGGCPQSTSISVSGCIDYALVRNAVESPPTSYFKPGSFYHYTNFNFFGAFTVLIERGYYDLASGNFYSLETGSPNVYYMSDGSCNPTTSGLPPAAAIPPNGTLPWQAANSARVTIRITSFPLVLAGMQSINLPHIDGLKRSSIASPEH